MATTYNIVEKRYNGTDYDTLYPATKGENLVSPVPVELGGTGGTTGAAGMKNLLDALSTVTPTGTDLLPLKDVSGNIAGKATIDSILSLVSGGAKIQTGSYVGTGTYGQANPCSLTFDSTPIMVVIYKATYTPYAKIVSSSVYFSNDHQVFYKNGASFTCFTNRDELTRITITGNALSWYSDTSIAAGANTQMNTSGTTYYYIAFMA